MTRPPLPWLALPWLALAAVPASAQSLFEPAPPSAGLGRLFATPAQRVQMDGARAGQAVQPAQAASALQPLQPAQPGQPPQPAVPAPPPPLSQASAPPRSSSAVLPGYRETPSGYAMGQSRNRETASGYAAAQPNYREMPPGYAAGPSRYRETPPGYAAPRPGYTIPLPQPAQPSQPAVAGPPKSQLDGVVRSSSGHTTVWIDQVPDTNGSSRVVGQGKLSLRLSSGRRLIMKPGQRYDTTDGRVKDADEP